jgi:hypothetical protein
MIPILSPHRETIVVLIPVPARMRCTRCTSISASASHSAPRGWTVHNALLTPFSNLPCSQQQSLPGPFLPLSPHPIPNDIYHTFVATPSPSHLHRVPSTLPRFHVPILYDLSIDPVINDGRPTPSHHWSLQPTIHLSIQSKSRRIQPSNQAYLTSLHRSLSRCFPIPFPHCSCSLKPHHHDRYRVGVVSGLAEEKRSPEQSKLVS